MRKYTLIDIVINFIDKSLINLAPHPKYHPYPAPNDNTISTANLSYKETQNSIKLLRVDHSGEICAQALYYGQMLTARHSELLQHLQEAAHEEAAHLSWCAKRLEELDGRQSLLTPLWAIGSFAIGALAGIAGDKWSLGFLAETEEQVTEHLANQLKILPKNDYKTQAILEQMKADEQKHASDALKIGGKLLPKSIKLIMSKSAKIMTITAKYI